METYEIVAVDELANGTIEYTLSDGSTLDITDTTVYVRRISE